jgi:hypothetical protein
MSIFSHHSRSSSKTKHAKWHARGFTLVEMLTVMGIMILITTTLLVRQNRFNSSTVLRSLAYSVALSVRQAQVYGTSVVGTTTSSGACTGGYYSTSGICYAAGYGININWGTGNPTSYTLFADLNNNGKYDPNETVKTFSLGRGYQISSICVITSGGTQYCPAQGLTFVDINFRRPNPDACFTTNLASNTCTVGAAAAYRSATIQIQAQTDTANTRSVTVTSTGQVSVCALTGC